MLRSVQRPLVKSYLVSLLLVLIATVLTLGIQPFFAGKAPLVFFTIAVILCAAYGGIGPGLAGTAFSLGIALAFFQGHVFSLVMAQSSLILFAILGAAIAIVVGKLRGLNAALGTAREKLELANQELERANETLLHQREALSHSNEELQRFAYGLAHDLNNPLRSIGALTELLIARNAEKLDDSSKECGRMIVDGVQRMESMIRSLLDYAATVEIHGHDVKTDGNHALERVLKDLHYVIASSGTEILADPLPTLPVDENQLVQVFSNLIGNAVKYRAARKPEIRISVTDRGADWLFAIQDNGIGLDMKYSHDIFGMFKRLHSSKGHEGSGVGLALCKVVIQRNGGQIWVESELGSGSTFFFTLPKTVDRENLPAPAKAERLTFQPNGNGQSPAAKGASSPQVRN